YFDEFNLNFVRRLSAFDTVRGQFYGVANDSAYRAQDHGVVPERVNVTREKGDGSLPYRAEAGDFFAYFSYRTLQRPLKGAQVELQPQPSENGIRHSVVLVSGVDQPNWRHLHAKDNWTNGVSWLIELGPQARFSANVLHNSRQADAALGTPDRKQTVASLTGDYGWQWASNRLRLEGEVAGLRGDHDGYLDARGATDPASGRDRRGQGAFAQFSGAGLTTPLDYRLRFERYDRDFRPVEAVISPDRRSEEAHIGWRFAEGLSLRGRALQYVDALQSGNDLKTTTYGVNLAGAFFAGMGGSIDLFWQELLKRDSSIDRGVWNTNANFTKPLPNQWVGNLGLFWQQVHDRVPGAGDTRSAQVQLGATHALNLGGWYGTFTPGITLRRARGASSGVTEVSPALAFALTRNAHSVGASYGYQRLRPDVTSLATIDVNMLRVDYRYTRGRDTFGVEAFAYDRRVTVGEFNDTYRLSVFWTHLLDKPARAAPRLVAVAMPDASAPLPRDVGVLLAVSPGADLAASLRRLEDAGYRGGVAQGNVVVFESRLLNEIDQRQRLAVEHDAGRVARVGLVVSIEDPNNAPAIAQTYERVRKALLDRYGAPALTFEEGAIGPTFVADLNAGRIIRAMEWQTDTGKLRLGIPRRLDGQVRIEIQHAPAFNSPRDALWSLESVR
ncbi:MAG TPA: hypothetical protein VN878_00005, partial [Usitatibacter sp.]|nr:hypothetical protein [Usitatibacter sp.]